MTEEPILKARNSVKKTDKFISLEYENWLYFADGESSHSAKRLCRLYGPIITITDTDRISPTFVIFAPQWFFELKEAPKHSTIVFTSHLPSNNKVLKLKSRDSGIIRKWYETFKNNMEEVFNLQMSRAQHNIRILVNGSFVKGIFMMDPHKFMFRTDEIIGSYKRGPDFMAAPDMNDPKRINIFFNKSRKHVLRFPTEDKARTLLVETITRPPDISAIVPLSVIDETTEIPDLSDIDLGATGASSSIFQSNRNSWRNSRGSTFSIKDDDKNASTSFNDKIMRERLTKVLTFQSYNDRVPSTSDLYRDFCRSVANQYPEGNKLPDVVYPIDTDENPVFQMNPDSPITSRFFSNEIFLPPAPDVTIKSAPKMSIFPVALNSVLSTTGIDFAIKYPTESYYSNILKLIRSMPPDQYYIAAAGLFLQRTKEQISKIGFKLQQHTFTIRELNDYVSNNPIGDKESCITFFAGLADGNMLSPFFSALYPWKTFRSFYHPDALLSCESIYLDLISIFNNAKPPSSSQNAIDFKSQFTKQNHNYPYERAMKFRNKYRKNEERLLSPFISLIMPEIIVHQCVNQILTIPPLYFLEYFDSETLTPFSRIFASIVYLCSPSSEIGTSSKCSNVIKKIQLYKPSNLPDLAIAKKLKTKEERMILSLLYSMKYGKFNMLIKEVNDNQKKISAVYVFADASKLSDYIISTNLDDMEQFIQSIAVQTINYL